MTDDEQEALFLSAGPSDEYKLTKMGFTPDVIYDIGADVGSITMFAHQTFPNAKIVAVEPNPWSFPRLKKNAAISPNIIAVNAGVGTGPMWQTAGDWGPLHHQVLSENALSRGDGMVPSTVPSVTLAELYRQHGGENYVVKLDCEGAETGIISHRESMQVIHGSAYFAAELHYWGKTPAAMKEAVSLLLQFEFDLAQTHTVYGYAYGACKHVWAKRRTPPEHVEAWNG